jgi:hypothetical protein
MTSSNASLRLTNLFDVFVGSFDFVMADPNEIPVSAGAITSKPMTGMRLRLKVLDRW